MKITIITPDGRPITFSADFWEFSEGKYQDEDIVLFFYKRGSQLDLDSSKKSDNTVIEESEKSIRNKPSERGIISFQSEETEELYNVRQKKFVDDKRKLYKVTFNESLSVPPDNKVVIKTKEFSIMQVGSMDDAIEDLVIKERNCIEQGYEITVITPPVIKSINDSFYIEEVIGYAKKEQ